MFYKHSHHSSRFTTLNEESDNQETCDARSYRPSTTLASTSLSLYNRPYLHTKSIPKSLIEEGYRSKSILYHMCLLSNDKNVRIRPSRREREKTILFTDSMELYHHKIIKRVKEMCRRKSCNCGGCGIKTKFERKHDDFEVRTQQAISSDIKLLSFTRQGQKKKQTIIKEFKIKQINEKKIKAQYSSMNTQLMINLPSTQRESFQVDQLDTQRSLLKSTQHFIQSLPSIKNIVPLTILKQIYIAGKQQKQCVIRKPSHDYLIMKAYKLK
ncbi:unnamed protein product (macronuclear) [Paramecium tetraurelia]|uniref:Uncharacterized protein n=1 Tax=Paramecium tetraurelia TaxID=5888 RepID=A0CME9_PARTE|nr:uncharacterized protein GSPATT00008445001 [Paramecium tetraurelia]CAK71966.1 unnamed protein product [Paramecium tetraurelia]|eukprot:XP_001439363.1 hypothetical protein (macronuclear) [Paramecium tetraurelia strain d4-2]